MSPSFSKILYNRSIFPFSERKGLEHKNVCLFVCPINQKRAFLLDTFWEFWWQFVIGFRGPGTRIWSLTLSWTDYKNKMDLKLAATELKIQTNWLFVQLRSQVSWEKKNEKMNIRGNINVQMRIVLCFNVCIFNFARCYWFLFIKHTEFKI